MKKFTFQLVYGTAIIILLFSSFFTYKILADFESNSLQVVHSQQIKNELAQLSNEFRSFSTKARNVILRLESLSLKELQDLELNVNNHINRLDSLLSDNATQFALLQNLKPIISNYNQYAAQLIDTTGISEPGDKESILMIADEKMMLSTIIEKTQAMRSAENNVFLSRLEQLSTSKKWAPIMLLMLVGIAIFILTLLFFNTFSLYKSNASKAYVLKKKLEELEKQTIMNNEITQLLQHIFDSSIHGIVAFNSLRNEKGQIIDFKFEKLNTEGANIIGQPTDEITGNTMLRIVPGNEDSGLFDKYVQVVENGLPHRETTYYHFDGIDKWFDISAVKNGDGLVITFSDISEIKKYEKELLDKTAELESTNHELEQFAYIASHDLQEPLRKIRAFGDRLVSVYQNQLDEKGRDYIERMQNASARMQTLIDDLLKFSRISNRETSFEEIDLNVVAKNVLDVLAVDIEEKNARITIDKLPNLRGNKSQLNQLFQNLLSNSLKYSKSDLNPKITITKQEVLKEYEGQRMPFWMISIRDNGIGFDNEYREQIFVIFQRLHGRSEYSGTGIGLAICQKIITNHNGLIEAEGEKGKGANFIIYLPKT